MSEASLYKYPLHPLSGHGVKFDPKQVLGRSQRPTVQGYLAHKKLLPPRNIAYD